MNVTLNGQGTVRKMLLAALLVAMLLIVTAGVANAQGRNRGA